MKRGSQVLYTSISRNKKKAKAFVLSNGKYIKYKDFSKEIIELNIEGCKVQIDFSKIFE